MNRLTKKIGLVLISSSLVLAGCAQHEDEIAERDDGSRGKDSAAPTGSNFSSSSPYHHSSVPGFQQFSNGGHPTTNSFSRYGGGSHSGSSRGGFGASAHGGGS